jgi:nucleoside-diphosphate-sugar epimerase
MRVLVLGGTVFLGRHVASEALARGHALTLFTRGVHGAGLFPEARHLHGDRSGDLTALEDGEWDVVVDTSGYRAADVAASAELLADRCGHYVFVSSINAYPAWPAEPVDEDSPVWQSADDDYGPQKAASERAAEAAMPGRVAAVRAGLIVGPHDGVFRLPWWVRRISLGGDVPAPAEPSRTVQIVDARDLAAWMLDLGERGVAGTFNGTGPIGQATMGELLGAAVEATGSGARLRWVAEADLRAAGVEPWTELPLWAPEDEMAGAWRVGTERAAASGLRCRPVAESVADVRAWLRDGGEAELSDWGSHARPAPMSAERERELLALARPG